MSHARKQLRDAIVTACTGLTTTGVRVYPSRVHPLAKGADPSLFIYALEEATEPHTMARPRILLRTATFAVHGVAVESSGLDDVLDQIAAEVEAALCADVTLGGKALDMLLARTLVQFDGSGDQPVGMIRLEFLVQYRTTDAAPQTILS